MLGDRRAGGSGCSGWCGCSPRLSPRHHGSRLAFQVFRSSEGQRGRRGKDCGRPSVESAQALPATGRCVPTARLSISCAPHQDREVTVTDPSHRPIPLTRTPGTSRQGYTTQTARPGNAGPEAQNLSKKQFRKNRFSTGHLKKSQKRRTAVLITLTYSRQRK